MRPDRHESKDSSDGSPALPITLQTVIPEDYIDVMGHMNVMWYTHLFGKATGGLSSSSA